MSVDSTLLETVRRTRRELAHQGPRYVRADGDFGRVSIPESDGDALRDLLLDEDARVLIEIGLGYGSSALADVRGLIARRAFLGSVAPPRCAVGGRLVMLTRMVKRRPLAESEARVEDMRSLLAGA